MTLHLDTDVADLCIQRCTQFTAAVGNVIDFDLTDVQTTSPGAFDTARQIGAVYSLFAGEDLRTLLNGYIDQAKAMSMLFAAAGGLIEAQDEAVAAALVKAAQEPAGLQSLGLMGSLGSTTGLLDAADGVDAPGGYDRVGPEEVSGAPLARMVSGAQALEPEQFGLVSDLMGEIGPELQKAAADLRSGLGDVLGTGWQGEFATSALVSVGSFTQSVDELGTALVEVASRARAAEDGFVTTRNLVVEESAAYRSAELRTPGFGPVFGPPSLETSAAMAAARAEAEEQARAIVNTVYSPAVMRANLDDLDFPAPYRVVSSSAQGGAIGFDIASMWNVEGVVRPAGSAVPSAAALAAAGGGGSAGGGPVLGGVETGVGATTTTWSNATDAATEQALLASRGGAVDGGAAGATSGGHAQASGASAGGVNAATTAAGAPFVPGATANGRQSTSGVGAGGIRGIRGGVAGRDRDRAFGSAAGALGGGGAAAAGAGASRMGGAGTLAGMGSLGGPGAGGVSGGAGSAAGPAGAFSSSPTGGAQAGRAGGVPMGGMMGAAAAGQKNDRRDHTPAGYLVSATNTSAILGEPVKVAPAVLGRKPVEEPSAEPEPEQAPRTRVIGRDYSGGGSKR